MTNEYVSVSIVHDPDTGEIFRHSRRWTAAPSSRAGMRKDEESLPPPTFLQRIEQNDPTLTELAGFGGYSCRKVAAALRRNNIIDVIKLNNCHLGDDGDYGCQQIMQALIARNSSLKRICLARNFIGYDGAVAIANFIITSRYDYPSHHSFIRLDLLQNCIGDEGARVIADAITNGTKVDNTLAIADIGFEKNGIGDEGLFSISSMLFCENNSLHTLRLGKNLVSHEGVVKSLAPALSKNNTLRVLDLSGNRNIGDLGATALAEILCSNNQTLETLVLTKCSITEIGALRLLHALYNDTSPSAVLEESNHTLRELILSENPIMTTSLVGRTNFLRDAIRWNQNGIATARIYKLNCFLTSSQGPRYIHAIDLKRELVPKLVFKIWRISSVDVVYAYIRDIMPKILGM